MLQTLLTKIGLPLLVGFVSEALGAIDNPAAKGASKALSEVDAAFKAGAISPAQVAEANRHGEAMLSMRLEQNAKSLAEINQSLRAEIASQDKYVRRMRPTFGYLMALTWAAQMLGIAYILVFDTARAGAVIHAVSSLSAIWAVGLSVLGIYVYKRSEDKKNTTPLPEVIFWDDIGK